MNRIEQAQQDAEILWARLPSHYQKKVREQHERLGKFLSSLQDTVEGEGDLAFFLEGEIEE